ncbi:MAG: NAD-dependent epimerase/dehydratase family protein [Anaerolineales bacterium]
MSNYLITGIAGFIAARIRGVIASRWSHRRWRGQHERRVRSAHQGISPQKLQAMKGSTFHQLDVADKSIIEKFKGEKFDAVIKLRRGAGVRSSVENPWVFVETNMIGTLNMLELCKENGIKKFVVASTSSIYGEDLAYPTPESADSSKPPNRMRQAKKGAGAMCYAYHHLYGIDVSIPRFFTVYGPAGRPDLAHLRFTQWISEGKPVRQRRRESIADSRTLTTSCAARSLRSSRLASRSSTSAGMKLSRSTN